MHLLKIVPNLVTHLETVVNRVFLAKLGVARAELLEVELDCAVEGVLRLDFALSFLHRLEARRHELESVVIPEAVLAYRSDRDALDLLPKEIGRLRVDRELGERRKQTEVLLREDLIEILSAQLVLVRFFLLETQQEAVLGPLVLSLQPLVLDCAAALLAALIETGFAS